METERSVWIVQHDQSSHNTIPGVFATGREAEAFAEEVKDHFDNGVLLARFVVGYRSDTNRAGYGTGDETQHPNGYPLATGSGTPRGWDQARAIVERLGIDPGLAGVPGFLYRRPIGSMRKLNVFGATRSLVSTK